MTVTVITGAIGLPLASKCLCATAVNVGWTYGAAALAAASRRCGSTVRIAHGAQHVVEREVVL
jgi:hypothetical protein